MNNHIYIISNFIEFDKKGKMTGIKGKIIHPFNKNEDSLRPKIYKKIKKRKNVILLGDSLGDLSMIESFNYDNLIEIVFLNCTVDELLDEYKKNFDVVLLNDADMNYVNDLLKEMVE